MNSHKFYTNRSQAGKVLAQELAARNIKPQMILALPRGGVPIAKEIAEHFNCPLDVLIVRKIGEPYNPEYGMGAMSEDLEPLFSSDEIFKAEELDEDLSVEHIVAKEKLEVTRRMNIYRRSRALPDVKGKTIILVDDGIATGVTAAAAGRFLKSKGASKVILAVPVGPQKFSQRLLSNIDEIVCPYQPSVLSAIGLWYENFEQVSDEEVKEILSKYHPE